MLASIQKITNLLPIENADKIERANVLGWQVVVEKNKHKIGELVIFVTIDSILPDRPEFAFLAGSKFRVRTIKLRGALSQGIIFPATILPEGNWEEGTDVETILNIQHYEKPVPGGFNQGDTKGNWPGFFPHTDEERIQNFPEVLKELKSKPYYITTKMDGSSISFYYNNGIFGVCSRNLEKKDTENSAYWQMAKKYNIEEKLKNFGKNIVLQAELVGPGIQKNHLKLPNIDIFVFNIYSIDDGVYMGMEVVSGICHKFDIPMVPIEETGLYFPYDNIDILLEKAKGLYFGTNNKKEGIVVRPIHEMYSEVLRGRLSFKVLNNDFLIENKE